nr:MAG: hypothetical protein [White spot syndrome virus]
MSDYSRNGVSRNLKTHFWNRRFWRGRAPRTVIASSDLPFREEILLILHLKNFLKIFLGRSSLEGGPLGRPNVRLLQKWLVQKSQNTFLEQTFLEHV